MSANDFPANAFVLMRDRADDEGAGILHLVGLVTEEVFGFLGPATEAIAETGVAQTVVMLDDPHYTYLNRRFHPSIRLVCIPSSSLPAFRRWAWLLRAFGAMLAEQPFFTIHLHGFLPCLLGGYVIARRNPNVRVVYSPHGSKSLGSLRYVGILLRQVFSRRCALARQLPVASIHSEARTLKRVNARPVRLVENGIGTAFLRVARNEARRPLIVTAGGPQGYRNVELFAQLAVLLGSKDLGLSFNWYGPTDEQSRSRLNAAQIGVFNASTDSELATRLASAWIYLQPGEGRGFPLHVARAMAVGVPCIVGDTDYHRDMIRDGETGFLYRTDAELVRYIAQLIDDKALRGAIGRAAREEAWKRFGAARFRDSLLQVYGLNQSLGCNARGY